MGVGELPHQGGFAHLAGTANDQRFRCGAANHRVRDRSADLYMCENAPFFERVMYETGGILWRSPA